MGAGTTFAPVVPATVTCAVTGLDGFGRVIDMPYVNGADSLLQLQYGYDKASNRTFARINDDAPDASWLYEYDPLNRLTLASKGTLNPEGSAMSPGTAPEITVWNLDILGNWSGDPDELVSMRRFADNNGDGCFSDITDEELAREHHETNDVNEIVKWLTVDPGSYPGPDNPRRPFYYDPGGNLVFDDQYHYVYDAWNRLVQINEPDSLEVDENGDLIGLPGDVITRFEYDALGRRIETHQRPNQPDEKITRHVHGSGPEVLEEYGVDVTTSGTVETLERWFVHGESFPDPLVMVDLTDAGNVPADADQPEEYLFYLKDALGSVMALADAAGEVVERYVYDPFGHPSLVSPDDGYPPLKALEASYFHDADIDNSIEDSDETNLDSCLTNRPTRAPCVFMHDRDGNHRVDVGDDGIFSHFYGGAGTSGVDPPADWERPHRVPFDTDVDADLDLFDLYGFQQCIGRIGVRCRFVYDFDLDQDIDIDDWVAMREAFAGPNIKRVTTNDYPSRYGNPFLFTAQRYDADNDMYHFVHRSYKIPVGRFVQPDPNGSGLPVMVYSQVDEQVRLDCDVCDDSATCDDDLACGDCPESPACSLEFDPYVQYGDGLNLYAYLQAMPTNGHDPYGLAFALPGLSGLLTAQTIASDVRAGYGANVMNSGNIAISLLLTLGLTLTWDMILDGVLERVAPIPLSTSRKKPKWKCRTLPRNVCPPQCQTPFEATGPTRDIAKAAAQAACIAAGCHTPGEEPYNCNCGHTRCIELPN